ncbi:hypothetical protein KED41_001177 [Escherichia coli]|nr:hypothetical protein [Escherichia coli]
MSKLLARFCARRIWRAQIFYNLKIHSLFKFMLLNTPFNPIGEITAYTERFMQCACADNARFISANNAR